MVTLEPKLQELYDCLKRMDDEIKAPVDERIQDCLKQIYEILGVLAARMR